MLKFYHENINEQSDFGKNQLKLIKSYWFSSLATNKNSVLSFHRACIKEIRMDHETLGIGGNLNPIMRSKL